MGEHPGRELFDGDGDAEVNGVSDEVGRVDFGIVDFNHRPIFCETFLSNVATDGGRQNDMAEDTVLPLLPDSGDIHEEPLEVSDRLRRLLQQGQDLIPLHLSALLVQLLSRLQSTLELLDEDMLAADLGLDGRDMFLDSSVAKQQDVLAALADVAALVELVGIFVGVEDHVSGCDEVELAGVAIVGDEESGSSLDGWGNLGADGETEGSGERLEDPDSSTGGKGRLTVHLWTGGADDLRLTNFDVDIVDIVGGKDTFAMSRDFDAILGREAARDNSYTQ